MDQERNKRNLIIEPDDGTPGFDGSSNATGERQAAQTITRTQSDAATSKPMGRVVADVGTAKGGTASRHNLRKTWRVGTWNVRSMYDGKLDIVNKEMKRMKLDIIGVSEMRWIGMGRLKSNTH